MKKTESADGARLQGAELRRKAEQLLRKKKKAGPVETPAEIDSRALIHELQVHQIELEMQNKELQDAQAAVEELSIKYMDLFAFAPIGYFLWDEQGKILDLNLAGAIMLGLERSIAIKKRFGQFVALEDRPIFADFCKKVILAKTKLTCEIKLLIDVKPLDVLIEGISGLYLKGEGVLCRAAVIDVTQRKQVDSLTKLRHVSEALLAETDLENMLQRIVNAADDLIGARIIVSGYDYADGSFTVGPTSLAARDMLNAPEKRIPLGQGMLYIELILKEGTVRLSEQAIRRYYRWNLPPGHPPLRGLLGAKLTASDGRPEGLIVLSDKTGGGEFTADDQILLAQLANIACLGLRNIDARRKAEDRAGQLAAANQALEREIVAHVKTEAALRENEIRYRTVADYTYDWEYWTGPDEISLGYVSPACQRISGYSAQEFLNNPGLLESIVHAEDQASRAEHVRQSHDNPNPMRLEYRIITKEGQTRWIEHICQRVYGPDGQSLGHRASNRDITDRKQTEQALCESQADLNRAQKVACTGSWRLDMRRNELSWSEETHRMFGIPKGTAMTYETFIAAVHPDDRELVDRSWQAALRGNPYDIEHRIITDDAVKWVRERAELEFDEQGLLLGGFGTVQDVTELKRAEEELRQAKDAAEAANRAKSQFFANISHDLRTPMNAILGMTELALGDVTDPAVRDYLQTAKESANVLLELLNEVLDLSRMEAGKFQLESAPFNLRAMLGQALKILEMRAHEKGLQLKCAISEDVPDGLAGDPLRLRQVLMNLVGNSVKFTTRGEVNVRIDVLSRSAEDVELKFLVEDTGIGISPQDQERIFIPFTQAETSTSRIYGGTGLGLTIASNLVELMGGRIWVESQLGQGSKFHFIVRLGIATAPPSPPDQPACESLFMDELPATVKPLRILLAEDNPASQKLVNYILNKRGHHVEVAQNGQEALERVEREDLDAVLMDIHMSIMDGFEATAAIRALPDLVKARLPIIAMTASAMKGDQERCLAAGMDAYISKPMSANDLITIVERLGAKTAEARTSQMRENRSAAPGDDLNHVDPRQPAPASAANVFNLDEAVKRCFRKYELFQDMVGCLFDESDSLLEQMRTALKSGDAEELGRTAHRLKGTVVFLGAPSAADATMRVEQIGLSGELDNAAEAIDKLQTQLQLLKEAVAPHRKGAR